MQILRHVGSVVQMDFNGNGVPLEVDFRVCMMIDLSQPLIPGCFLALDGGQMVWVYFRYEGVFKFSKKCGCVGHYTSHCRYSAYDAHSWIRRKIASLESNGFRVLSGPMNLPYYSNMIEGLPDRYRYRNVRVDLLHQRLVLDNDDPVSTSTSTSYEGDGTFSRSRDSFHHSVSRNFASLVHTLVTDHLFSQQGGIGGTFTDINTPVVGVSDVSMVSEVDVLVGLEHPGMEMGLAVSSNLEPVPFSPGCPSCLYASFAASCCTDS